MARNVETARAIEELREVKMRRLRVTKAIKMKRKIEVVLEKTRVNCCRYLLPALV